MGILLQIVGWFGALWCAFVGGSFSLVYALGFIGTKGREAGGELAVMLTLTVLGIGIGYIVARLGLWIASPAPADTSGSD